MEDGNAVVEGGRWVLVNDVLLERGFEGSVPFFTILCLCLFQDGNTGVDGVVEIGIIGYDAGLDTKLLPAVSCPLSLDV